MTTQITFDGGSRGNPGLCGIGYVISIPGKDEIHGSLVIHEKETNNYAEYNAVIHAMIHAHQLEIVSVNIRGDSALVINQIKGTWKCNEKLQPLLKQARELFRKFKQASICHIPRSQNAHADALANKAMDEFTTIHV